MMNTINIIKFNDGYLELQQDDRNNYLMCAVGVLAHTYYYKFSKIAEVKLPKAFEMFNDCTLVL